MRYQAYEVRREILQGQVGELERAMLILLEYIDWHTGQKWAQNKGHLINWLDSLSSKHGLDPHTMKWAVQMGLDVGWLALEMLDSGYLILSMAEK